ncbi:NADH-quinone oxidoreductase subunit N [Alphaproteobacteria bacterium]|nr:NADH-quinone oxidoreductase subunit N [Alphaproteobacteria bacterium]
MPSSDQGLLTLLPEMCLSLWAIFLLLVGVWRQQALKESWVCLLTLIVVAFAFSGLIVPEDTPTTNGMQAFFGSIDISRVTQSMKGYFLILVFFVLSIIIPGFSRLDGGRMETLVLCLFSIVGGALLFCVNDFLLFFVALELLSFSLYLLVALWKEGKYATEAAMKYFVTGGLASALLLMGVAFIYGQCGTVQFDLVEHALLSDMARESLPPLAYLGMGLVICSLCFKLSVAPFHMWAPDVYRGSSLPALTFLGSLPKVAAVGAMTLLLKGPFSPLLPSLTPLLGLFAALSMLWGALGALMQTNIKRFVAYSGISQMGFVLLGFMGQGQLALEAFNYSLIYAVTFAGMLGTLAYLEKTGEKLETFEDFSGLSERYPLQGFVFAVFLFSTVGIPPLAGFFAKLMVFKVVLKEGYYTLFFVAIVSSVISAAYALRLLRHIYFLSPSEALPPVKAWRSGGILSLLDVGSSYVAASFIFLFVFFLYFMGRLN